MTPEAIEQQLQKAYNCISKIIGKAPTCSAAPGWRCTESALELKEKFHFQYNSDCRGDSIFMPVVNGKILTTPQIPLSMPTYDEVIGKNGITNENYNEYLLTFAHPDQMNLLTIHAEVEGGSCSTMFDKFLTVARQRGIEFVPPGELLTKGKTPPAGKIIQGKINGREGITALQKSC
ncbi:MAG: hypothetical protein RR060_00220 [Victivallaceae bacterium]